MTISPFNAIAIDPSLRSTGIYYNGRTYSIVTAAEKGRDNTDEALYKIYKTIQKLIEKNPPTICLLEDYSFASKGNAVTTIAEVKGIIKAALLEKGVQIVKVNIAMWKGLAGFHQPKKGAGWKANYLEAAYKKTGYKTSTPDEVDAYFIYHAVIKILEKGGHTEAQLKIYNQVEKILKEAGGEKE